MRIANIKVRLFGNTAIVTGGLFPEGRTHENPSVLPFDSRTFL
jgi:hypothetical protein